VEVWIVDCLQDGPSPAHSYLDQTLGWIARVKPRLAILTHMNHRLGYAELAGRLPQGVVPAYDGLSIELAEPRADSPARSQLAASTS
jgi:phosphoribosyl 1,2-cyclic phosphate phosphodiesterase